MPQRGLAAWGLPLAGNLDVSEEGEAREGKLLREQGGSSRSGGRRAEPLLSEEL